MNLKDLVSELEYDDLYNGNRHSIHNNEGERVCYIEGFPSCCGQAIIHDFHAGQLEDSFEDLTRELRKLLQRNQFDEYGEGIGCIIATTSDEEGFTSDNFQANKFWKPAHSFNNPNTSRYLTTWILDYE